MYVICPNCGKDRGESVEATIDRNMASVRQAAWAVFEYRPSVPSFGVPVEIWERSLEMAGTTLVVGELGGGIFAQALTNRGVRVVSSWEQAVAIMAAESGR